MVDNRLADRDRAEVQRSASEAKKTALTPSEVERYLNPAAATPYPLEYAFYLLGNVRGKTVLDIGCGTGENLPPLFHRGAKVMGMDISPDLIELAKRRLNDAGVEAVVSVGSAYETEIPSRSIDVIFCMSLVHHLEIPRARDEMRRILAPDGYIILKEPIRFSKTYAHLRRLLPSSGNKDVSEYEHPLTRVEFAEVMEGFSAEGLRFFRLPFLPIVGQVFGSQPRGLWKADRWIIENCPGTKHLCTSAVVKLRMIDSGRVNS